MGKKSKIKKITEKQYMEYVAGLKNEPARTHGPESGNAETNGKNVPNDTSK